MCKEMHHKTDFQCAQQCLVPLCIKISLESFPLDHGTQRDMLYAMDDWSQGVRVFGWWGLALLTQIHVFWYTYGVSDAAVNMPYGKSHSRGPGFKAYLCFQSQPPAITLGGSRWQLKYTQDRLISGFLTSVWFGSCYCSIWGMNHWMEDVLLCLSLCLSNE